MRKGGGNSFIFSSVSNQLPEKAVEASEDGEIIRNVEDGAPVDHFEAMRQKFEKEQATGAVLGRGTVTI